MFQAGLRPLSDRLDAGRRRRAGGAVSESAARDRPDGGTGPEVGGGEQLGGDRRSARERGFVLLEEIVSISLLMIVMAALATFFLTVVQSTTYQRAKQTAVQLSNTQMNLIRGVPAADLTLGRKSVAQFAGAPAVVKPALATMTASDDSTTTQTVSPTTTATVNNTLYTITNYLGTCLIPSGSGTNAPCVKTGGATTAGVPFLRAVVAVTWPGSRCSAGLCSYVTASLISAAPDPQFVLSQAPPAAPLVQNPGNQLTTLGATVSLQLALQPNTGVAPTTWAVTGLPAGLSQSTTTPGLITGTPTALTTATTVTVVATDAFVRNSPSVTFTWTVVAPPTITGLTNPFTTTAGATITPQPLTYTCPTAIQTVPAIGSSCTETLTGAPSGIGIATTRSGPFLPSVTVTDTGGSGPLYLGGTVSSTTTAGTTTTNTYAGDVANMGATNYWKLNDTTAGTAADSGTSPLPLTESAGVTQAVPGAILGSADTAATFAGTASSQAIAATAVAAPTTFSQSVWFRTTTTSGGVLLDYGSASTGLSTAYDRMIYMDNSGHIWSGVNPTGRSPKTLTSPNSYADGAWHQAVATLSPTAGIALYVDGAPVASDPTTTTGQVYGANGYWRLGGEGLSTWPGSVTSRYFAGTLDDVSIYPTALTPAQIQQQYADSGRTVVFSPVITPAAGATVTGTAVTGTPNTSSWTVVQPPTVTGLTTPFTTSAGATIANQTLPYTCPSSSCTYALAGTPSGIGLSTTSSGAGPFASSVTVSGSTSGNLYLRGTVDPAAGTSAAYANDVAAQGATNYWHLSETSGTTGVDAIGGTPLTESAGVGHGAQGAIFTAPSSASTFDGSSLGTARTQSPIAAPSTFSESIWFRTTTSLGGQLIGFGDSRTDARSSSHDRQVYLDTSGRVIFGVSPSGGVTSVVVSTGTYNDGAWHQVVATMKSGTGGGQSLYIDGKSVGTPQAITTTTPYNGYWRLGGDELNGWPAGPSSNFAGTLDEASIYPTALTPAQILQQYTDGVAVSYAVTVTPADALTGFVGTPNTAAWTVNPPPTVTGMVTPFTTTAGATVATQPLPYTCPSTSCTETLAGAPAGIGLNAADIGSPQSSVSTITTTSGNVFLRGTVGSAAGTSNTYATDVQTSALGATNYWRLGEAAGTTGTDLISGGSNLTYGTGVGHGAPGAIFTSTDTASTFSGAADGSGTASSQVAVAPPAQLSESIWFKTTTTAGGWLLGMTNVATGSGNYDRALYLDNAGHVNLELYNGGQFAVTTSPGTYTDGAWHQAVATVSPTLGVSLYIDGSLVSANAGHRAAAASGLYWRLGGGGRLTTDLSSVTPISSNNFQGSLDEAAVFSTVLTANDVSKQYLDAKRVVYSLTATPTDVTTGVTGPVTAATWAVRPAPAVSGLVTPFSTTVGATITPQPLSYSCPSSTCTYTVTAPAGIGLAATSSGTAGSSLAVTSGSGTLYLVGTVGAGAAGSSTVSVTPTDTASGVTGTVATAAWTVNVTPSISGLTAVTVAAGATITAQPLAYTCPTASCTYALTGAPPGTIGLSTSTAAGSGSASLAVTATSGTVYLVGAVSTSAAGSYPLVITPKATGTTTTGTPAKATLTVAVAAVSGLASPFSTTVGATIASQPLAFSCPSSACSYALAGAPAGIGLSLTSTGTASASVSVGTASGTIYLVGTVGGSPNTFTPTLTPRDTVNNVSGTTVQAAWTVYAKPTVTGLTTPFTTSAGATIANQSLPYTCPSSSCTFTVAGAPAGIGLSATAGGTATNPLTITGSASGTLYLRGTVDPSAGTTSAYANDVVSQGASNYWRLGDVTGSRGADSVGSAPLTESAGVGHGAPGGIPTSQDAASTFDGSALGTARSQVLVPAPSTFTESIWFRTTTTQGGQLIGFGDSNTDARSGAHDRQLYMDASGRVIFGVSPTAGVTSVAVATGPYNDGAWHQAVATMRSGSSGVQSLYLDGRLVSSQAITSTVAYNGYWRLGGDDLAAWPSGPSSNFAGTLDEAAVYSTTALTAAQVQQQWADARAATVTATVTPTDTVSGVSGTGNQAAWTINPAAVVTGLTTPFATNPNAVVSQALSYSCPSTACSIALTGAPSGIGLSASGTGATSSSVAVTAASGYVYLRGTVGSSASGSYAVAVTPTDTATSTVGTPSQATWTVSGPPTVSGLPSSASVTAGQVVANIPLTFTCPSSSCAFAFGGGLSGVGLDTDTTGSTNSSVSTTATSGTIYLRGTVTSPAGNYSVTVTPVDTASGGSGTVSQAAVTVLPAPTTGSPGTVSRANGTSISQPVTYSCPAGGCTLVLSGYPSGVGLSTTQNSSSPANSTTSITEGTGSGSFHIQGRTPSGTSAKGTYTVTVTITDANGVSTSSSGTWTIT